MAELWQHDGLSQKQLGTSLIKTKSSINKMLDALAQSGMITKQCDDHDKRTKRIFLTEKGKEFRHFVQGKSKQSEEELLGALSQEDITTAKRVLETLYKKLSTRRNDRLGITPCCDHHQNTEESKNDKIKE